MSGSFTTLASAPFGLGGCRSCCRRVRVGLLVTIYAASLLTPLQDTVLVKDRDGGTPKGDRVTLGTRSSSWRNIPDSDGKL